jgi:hypothetical protein
VGTERYVEEERIVRTERDPHTAELLDSMTTNKARKTEIHKKLQEEDLPQGERDSLFSELQNLETKTSAIRTELLSHVADDELARIYKEDAQHRTFYTNAIKNGKDGARRQLTPAQVEQYKETLDDMETKMIDDLYNNRKPELQYKFEKRKVTVDK